MIAAVLAIIVAACSGGDSVSRAPSAPSASATAAPTPSAVPSPTAADVSAAFFTLITAPEFSAKETLTGNLKLGTTPATMTGSGLVSGGDSNETLTVQTGSTSQATSVIEVGTTSWTKTEPGPWVEDPKPITPKKDLSDYLHGVTGFIDLGVETRSGRQLHHLQAKGGNAIDAAFVGYGAGRNGKDAAFTVDFYATDDGTPAVVVISGTLTYVSGATETPASVTYEDALSEVGKPQTIAPPDDVWVRYTSDALGYTMAHPADWTVTSEKDKDTYLLDGQGYVYVALTPYKGTTEAFVTALKASYKKPFDGDPSSVKKTTLGGQAAERLIYGFTNDAGQEVTVVDDVTVRTGTGWEAFLVTAGGADDIAIFDQFVATFGFTP